MTATTVDPRCDEHPKGDLIADVVARMCETTDRLRAENRWDDEPQIGWLSMLLADAREFSRLVPTVPTDQDRSGRDLLEDVCSRLWMMAR